MRPGLYPVIFGGGAPVLRRAVAAWLDRVYDAGLDALVDLSGHGLNAQLGSSVGADTNDPLRLVWSGENYAYFPGTTGNHMSMASAAAIKIIDDIDIKTCWTLDNWNTGSRQTFGSKWDASLNKREYQMRIETDGKLVFQSTTDGTNATFITWTSSVVTGIAAGARRHIRFTRTKSTGVGRFYLSDDGVTWTQLGADVAGSTAAFFTSDRNLTVGVLTTSDPAIGRLHYFTISGSIDGAAAASVVATGLAEPYASYTDPQGNVWTLNRSTSGKKLDVCDAPLLQAATDDFCETQDSGLLNAASGFTVAGLIRRYGTPGSSQTLIAKKTNLTTTAGWSLHVDTSKQLVARLGDGSANVSANTGAISDGVLSFVALVIRNGMLYAHLNGVTSDGTAITIGSSANTEVLRMFRLSGAGTNYADADAFGWAVFRAALDDAALARLRVEMLKRIKN